MTGEENPALSDTTPIAGWYPDPVTPGQNRYWDGAAWTEHVQPAAPAAQVPAAPVLPSMDPVAAVAPGNGDQGGSYGAATTVKPKRTWLWILLVILGAVLLLFGGCTAVGMYTVNNAFEEAASNVEIDVFGGDLGLYDGALPVFLPDGNYRIEPISAYESYGSQCGYTGTVTDGTGTDVGVYTLAGNGPAVCEDGENVTALLVTFTNTDITITDRVLQ